MSKAAKSILVFGIYAVVVGLTFLVIPNIALALLGGPTSDEVWIRVLGLIVAILGYYYIQAARHELTPFFRSTVQGRPLVLVGFIVFVLLGLAKPVLIIFGVIDLLGALWTGLALRTSQC
jgi:hypothetical protein